MCYNLLGDFIMDAERLQKLTPEVDAPEQLSLETLQADPEVYKNRILLHLKSMPWDRSIEHVQGGQVEGLLIYCLDMHNLDPIDDSFAKIMAGEVADPEINEVLSSINSAVTPSTFKYDAIDIGKEKTLRRRLLAWADYLNDLANSSTATEVNGSAA